MTVTHKKLNALSENTQSNEQNTYIKSKYIYKCQVEKKKYPELPQLGSYKYNTSTADHHLMLGIHPSKTIANSGLRWNVGGHRATNAPQSHWLKSRLYNVSQLYPSAAYTSTVTKW